MKESSFGIFKPQEDGTYSHEINFEKMESYYSRDVCSLNPCTNCSYAYFCGGGCGHHAGGEDKAMCGTIHKDFVHIVESWAGAKSKNIPKTGVQISLGEEFMKKNTQCKPESKAAMKGL